MAVDVPKLKTARLRLRAWQPEDLLPFAELNADPVVGAHLRGPMTRADSDALADRMVAHFQREDFGVWAVQAPGIASFIGMVGLSEIVALTVPDNTRSRSVMSRLGMARDPTDDFAHPLRPAGHRLSRHVLYRLPREAWRM